MIIYAAVSSVSWLLLRHEFVRYARYWVDLLQG